MLLDEFEAWLPSVVAVKTAKQYKREIRLLDEARNDLGLPEISAWKSLGYDYVIGHLKQNQEWLVANKRGHNSSSAAVRKFFEFLHSRIPEEDANRHKPFFSDTFLSRQSVEDILVTLVTKRNIVLQGPPGTGKTYIAKRLAYALMQEEAKDRVEVVQFHQSYSYEDFIQGFRPGEGGGFERRDGVFFRFCAKARLDATRKYFFLIDEINRGNLSRIFGELMMLIEADKRGVAHQVHLTYSNDNEYFSIPKNIFIIGTMNTADRSLAMVDYALRRRFAFFNMPPQFNEKFRRYLQEEHSISGSMVKRIVEKMTALNQCIKADKNLGDGFEIGHSYFCIDVPKGKTEEDWLTNIVDYEIGPQLLEFWFDDKAQAEAEIAKLKSRD